MSVSFAIVHLLNPWSIIQNFLKHERERLASFTNRFMKHVIQRVLKFLSVITKTGRTQPLLLLWRIFIVLSSDNVNRYILNDPRTFYCNDYFVVGGTRNCLGVSGDRMFL